MGRGGGGFVLPNAVAGSTPPASPSPVSMATVEQLLAMAVGYLAQLSGAPPLSASLAVRRIG
jgi:hypothetical protein